MLGTTQEENQTVSITDGAGHHQPEAVGRAHLIYNGERAMGRCRDHRDKAGAKASRMAWTPGVDARSSSPQDMPVWMVTSNTTMRRSKKEVERPSEERSAGSRDM